MELSLYLAKVWGLFIVIITFSMMINKKQIAKMYHLAKEEGMLILMGMLSLVVGILSVLSHNIWVSSWPTIITIFGWLALLKGLMFLFFPDAARRQLARCKSGTVLMLIGFLLGLYLVYVGFLA
ncbi:MAG: hypothetical protein COU09_02775 [Candidatus Harrisonbacteria bacterium CG10_big_fil_rev_8_21_14_0_10_44_23]|uniref:Uncharacterized protein n=1 Tax=Candidatus Harrisonbacteria bacterium CG10_big_fil_rev_8_21_14_0_10_44_23 TaxID=1974585 RepID=A0A2H0URD9_9BACT|nr:MAG: hypothetical protein COU09_02775 [Candidatus Harrisonbacteria bacterium CG10_big_fil_rev_8_21_14_0_10_44_23]